MTKIALAQCNFCVGDIEGNSEKIIAAIKKAQSAGAKMVVFSELAITGYPPEDLLFQESLYEHVENALQKIKVHTQECYVVVGYPQKINGECFNTASVIYQGEVLVTHCKQFLPNYTVFDEERYFKSGSQTTVFDFMGIKTGLIICEDIWHPAPMQKTVAAGAEWVIVVNASPYDDVKLKQRIDLLQERITENKVPIVYVNQVCGQDELIFDGCSLAMNTQNEICAQAAFCQEDLVYIEIKPTKPISFSQCTLPAALSREAEMYSALVMATHDYVTKNKFEHVYIGLSGGIDSAVVLAIAVDALGADKVTAIAMPSQYTAEIGMTDARSLTQALHVKLEEIAITPMLEEFISSLNSALGKVTATLTEQNLQARIRAVLLMAFANKCRGLVLTTSNKSEVAVGYSTLYGDMAGGFDVLKDVYKTDVYRLAHYRNQIKHVIPGRIITRPPSAELAPNQTDQDDLPSYAELDQILKLLIEENQSVEKTIQAGFAEKTVKKVARLLKNSEYKRRQSPIGPRLTTRSFGKDWRFPVVNCSSI